jgi:hypothetical protein
MSAITIKEPYTRVLEHLGDLEQVVDEALRQYTIQQARQHMLDIQEKVQTWEEKYGCSYDLFAFRTSTDEEYVQELEAAPQTSQWEADLFSWEFYAAEFKAWRQRLQSILNA